MEERIHLVYVGRGPVFQRISSGVETMEQLLRELIANTNVDALHRPAELGRFRDFYSGWKERAAGVLGPAPAPFLAERVAATGEDDVEPGCSPCENGA